MRAWGWGTCHQCHTTQFILYPHPHCTCKEDLVFWATFLVTWGRVAPRSESSNQIAECIIIDAWCKRLYFEPNKNLSCAQLILSFLKRLLRPYPAFVTVQHSKSSENSSPGCKMQLGHYLCCSPTLYDNKCRSEHRVWNRNCKPSGAKVWIALGGP